MVEGECHLLFVFAVSADNDAKVILFIPRHTIVAGYYSFTLDVRVSVRPSARPSYVRPFFVSG